MQFRLITSVERLTSQSDPIGDGIGCAMDMVDLIGLKRTIGIILSPLKIPTDINIRDVQKGETAVGIIALYGNIS